MFAHSTNSDFSQKVAFHWFMLSFLSGSVNAGGFLSCQRFVTHTTGFATLAGIDFAQGQWQKGLSMVTVPAFFLAGVIIAAWLTVGRRHRGKSPSYALVMALESILLFAATLAGMFHTFGEFGTAFQIGPEFVLIALLCLASGLQNAAITSSSGATVRTTHLTGLTTDLGIGTVEMILKRNDPHLFRDLFKKNSMRMGTIFSFFLGSAVGASLFLTYGYAGFLLPSLMATYSTYVASQNQKPS